MDYLSYPLSDHSIPELAKHWIRASKASHSLAQISLNSDQLISFGKIT